jgi:hypothetical protein
MRAGTRQGLRMRAVKAFVSDASLFIVLVRAWSKTHEEASLNRADTAPEPSVPSRASVARRSMSAHALGA